MNNKHFQLSTAQRDTLLRIIEYTKKDVWRYKQPPASRYPKRTLVALQKNVLIKIVSCPMYLSGSDKLGKGVEVTELGNTLFKV